MWSYLPLNDLTDLDLNLLCDLLTKMPEWTEIAASSAVRKMQCLSLWVKLELLEKIENNVAIKDIMVHYKVGKSYVVCMWRNSFADVLKKVVGICCQVAVCQWSIDMRISSMESLIQWCTTGTRTREDGVPLRGTEVRNKARHFAALLVSGFPH